MQIAHFGTFDVANYGDLLLPLLVEKRLAAGRRRFLHVSPRGGGPVWEDCVETVPAERVLAGEFEIDAVITGGGHLLHASPSELAEYQRGGLSALVAYPGLWLGAAHLAVGLDVPVCWNAPGVPRRFSTSAARLIRWTAGVVDYLSVRDRRSRELLMAAGCRESIAVVPDTALEVSRLWSRAQIDEAYDRAFADRGHPAPSRSVAIHVNGRYVDEDLRAIALRLDRIGRAYNAQPILIALGPCHGDDLAARRLARWMQTGPLLIDSPRGLREVAACIGRSQAYFGSSLHGLITACSFGRPGMLVACERAEQGRKFSGFLEQFGLDEWLTSSWREAETLSVRLLESSVAIWQSVLQKATPSLDRHWARIERTLSGKTTDEANNGSSRRIRPRETSLAQFDQLCREHFAGVGVYQGVLFEQAGRVGDALAAADGVNRKLDELRVAHERTKVEFQQELAARRAAAAVREDAVHAQLAAERRAHRESQHDVDTLVRWIEDLESGVAALLASRRWRVGNLLGGAWSRLTGRRPVAMATDLFRDVFQRFHRWAGERQMPDAGRLRRPVDIRCPADLSTRRLDQITADVIICVHNALDDVRACLQAVFDCTHQRHRVILIDDGSGDDCRQMLVDVAERRPGTVLIHNDRALGYTRSANMGLRRSDADYAVLLNSDTLVSPDWLERLLECGESDPRIGIVGPLSGAASWQSVPRRFDAAGDWAVNPLPTGCTPADAAGAVAAASQRRFPRVALLNGFCVAIKREAIDAVGLLDEESFPHGYGEENDLCLRAAAAGFELAVADHAHVFHAKSRSYSHRRRRQLTVRGQRALRRKHGDAALDRALREQRSNAELNAARRVATSAIADLNTYMESAAADFFDNVDEQPCEDTASFTRKSRSDDSIMPGASAPGTVPNEKMDSPAGATSDITGLHVAPLGLARFNSDRIPGADAPGYMTSPVPGFESHPSILFLLPVRGGGGGAHSVVQEVRGMRALGVEAQTAVDVKYRPDFRRHYPEMSPDGELIFFYSSPDELTQHAGDFDVVVATVYFSVRMLKSIVEAHPRILPAYYVQDYEPRFFRKFSRHWRHARASYTFVPGMLHFAKTEWICNTVRLQHDVEVAKVAPSLDQEVFYPALADFDGKRAISVTAMIRPSTPYRGAARTMRVLRRLKQEFGPQMEVHLFGCAAEELTAAWLERDFEFTSHGVLTRGEVAELLRGSDVFLDLSDYQAFGRTGLEAMACRTAVVLPVEGGVTEYAVDGENALLVDTADEDECLRAARRLVAGGEFRRRLQTNAVAKAAEYSIRRAVVSELSLFIEYWRKHLEATSRETPLHVHRETEKRTPHRPRLQAIVPRAAAGQWAGSTYVRLALPLGHPANRRRFDLDITTYDRQWFPSGDVIVVQRNAIARRQDVERLVRDCRRSGRPLVYEIDDHLLALPREHPESAVYRRHQAAMRVLLENSDLVTVSTGELAGCLENFSGRIRVIPNALDENLWFSAPRPTFCTPDRGQPVRILAMGTRTHGADLAIIADAARRLRREFGRRVLFEVVGCVPPGTRSDWFRELDVPRSATEYPAFARWLRAAGSWHIGVAPLAPSPFSDSKSGLKYLDYAALGLAGVFSDAPPYRDLVAQLETGILTANTAESWFEALKMLVEDATLRENLAVAAHRQVADRHTLRQCAQHWAAAYEELPSGSSSPKLLRPATVSS